MSELGNPPDDTDDTEGPENTGDGADPAPEEVLADDDLAEGESDSSFGGETGEFGEFGEQEVPTTDGNTSAGDTTGDVEHG